MYAKAKGNPALRLRDEPNGFEILRIPYDDEVEIVSWDVYYDWAQVRYQGKVGYAMKEFLELVPESKPVIPEKEDEPVPFDASNLVIENLDMDRPYIVMQVMMEQKLFSSGNCNLTDIENIVNDHARRGYRLHTFKTEEQGMRIKATLVFEKI